MENLFRLYCAIPPYLFPFYSLLGGMGQQTCLDCWFWLRANKPVNKLSILEDQHGWNTLNLKLSCSARIFIDIQLGHAVATFRVGSQLIHDWANHAAGSAPGSPAIEQNCAFALQYLALKSGIGY